MSYLRSNPKNFFLAYMSLPLPVGYLHIFWMAMLYTPFQIIKGLCVDHLIEKCLAVSSNWSGPQTKFYCIKTYDLGPLPGKMLIVRIIQNNEINDYFLSG